MLQKDNGPAAFRVEERAIHRRHGAGFLRACTGFEEAGVQVFDTGRDVVQVNIKHRDTLPGVEEGIKMTVFPDDTGGHRTNRPWRIFYLGLLARKHRRAGLDEDDESK